MKTRERIASTTARLFYEQGYHATGINQIIAEASVAKASLYQLFHSKEELLRDYLEAKARDWWNDFDAFRGDTPEGLPMLRALFDYRMHLIRTNRFKGCSFVRIAYEIPELDGASAVVIREFKLGIRTLISTHVRAHRPELDRLAAADLTGLVVNLYEGSGTQAYLLRSLKPVEEAKKLMEKFLA
jgi:AcrR family transcriptional regulator